ncbi:MAG: hypothetical protein ACT4OF_12850 [Caulobacteraceae bacterium]
MRTAYRYARVWLWRFKRSREQQNRAAAMATFAFIGLFALGSVDAVITGGADIDIGATAYAGEYPSAQVVRAAHAAAPTIVADATADEETPRATAADDIDYSFTTEELLGGPELLTVTEELKEEVLAAEGDKPVETTDPIAGSEAQDKTVL